MFGLFSSKKNDEATVIGAELRNRARYAAASVWETLESSDLGVDLSYPAFCKGKAAWQLFLTEYMLQNVWRERAGKYLLPLVRGMEPDDPDERRLLSTWIDAQNALKAESHPNEPTPEAYKRCVGRWFLTSVAHPDAAKEFEVGTALVEIARAVSSKANLPRLEDLL